MERSASSFNTTNTGSTGDNNALALGWCFGFSKDVPDAVHSLSDGRRRAVAYAVAHTGVIYDYEKRTQRLLQGHCNPITAVAVSRDRRHVITADAGLDSMLVVWDSQTGTPVKSIFTPHPLGIAAVACSADGAWIATLSSGTGASGSNVGAAAAAEAADGASEGPQELSVWAWTRPGRDDSICSAAIGEPDVQKRIVFNPSDPRQIMTTGSRRTLFWGWHGGALRGYVPRVCRRDFRGSGGANGGFTTCCFLPGTTQALTATARGEIVLWDSAEGDGALVGGDGDEDLPRDSDEEGGEELGAASWGPGSPPGSANTGYRSAASVAESAATPALPRRRASKVLALCSAAITTATTVSVPASHGSSDASLASQNSRLAGGKAGTAAQGAGAGARTTQYVVLGSADGAVRFYDFKFRLEAWFEDFCAGPVTSVSFAVHLPAPAPLLMHGYGAAVNGGFSAGAAGQGLPPRLRVPDFVVATAGSVILEATSAAFEQLAPAERRGETLVRGFADAVVGLAAHPRRPWVAALSQRGDLNMWDYDLKELVGRWTVDSAGAAAAVAGAAAAAAAPSAAGRASGGIAAAANARGTKARDNLAEGKPRCVAFEPSGQVLAVGLSGGGVRLLDSSTLEDAGSLCGGTSPLELVRFSPNGNMLAAADDRHHVLLWRRRAAQHQQQQHQRQQQRQELTASAAEADTALPAVDDELLPSSGDGNRRQGNSSSGNGNNGSRSASRAWEYIGRHRAHSAPIVGLEFGKREDGAIALASVGRDRCLVEYDISQSSAASGLLLAGPPRRVEQAATPTAVMWHPLLGGDFEDRIVTASDAFKLRQWNADSKSCRRTALGPTFGGPVVRLAPVAHMYSDGTVRPSEYACYATADKVVGLIKLPLDGNPNKSMGLIAHPGSVSSIGVSADGHYLFTAGGPDLAVNVWRINTAAVDAMEAAGGSASALLANPEAAAAAPSPAAAAAAAAELADAAAVVGYSTPDGAASTSQQSTEGGAAAGASGSSATGGEAAAAAEPYVEQLEGGRDGDLYDELVDYFVLAQLQSDGSACGDDCGRRARATNGRVPLSALPGLMRALGYYPTEREVSDLVAEARYTRFTATGQAENSVDLPTFLRLFVNHRPVFPVGKQMLARAFDVLSAEDCRGLGRLSSRRLGELLSSGGGEAMSAEELKSCLDVLTGEPGLLSGGGTWDAADFAQRVLGFEGADGEVPAQPMGEPMRPATWIGLLQSKHRIFHAPPIVS